MPRPCREKLALNRDLRFDVVVLPHPNLVAFFGPDADIVTGAAAVDGAAASYANQLSREDRQRIAYFRHAGLPRGAMPGGSNSRAAQRQRRPCVLGSA